MSGRRRVDIQGVGPGQTLHWSASSVLNKELYWHSVVNIPVSSPWTRHYKEGPWESSPGTVPDITPHHQTWRHLPGLFPHIHILETTKYCRGEGLAYWSNSQTKLGMRSVWDLGMRSVWDLGMTSVSEWGPVMFDLDPSKIGSPRIFSLKYLDPIQKICSHYRPVTRRQISDY